MVGSMSLMPVFPLTEFLGSGSSTLLSKLLNFFFPLTTEVINEFGEAPAAI
jgi:G3E family GTPase